MATLGTVRIAAIVYPSGFQSDDFLSRVVNRLRADRVGLSGVLQQNAIGVAGRCSEMTVVDLASRNRFPISQDLGSLAHGCLSTRGVSSKSVWFSIEHLSMKSNSLF